MAIRTKKEQEVVAKKETPAVERVTSTRGYGKYDLKTGEFVYKPSKVGEPAKVNVKTEGKSEIYETTSKKKPLLVMTLKANKDSTDPVADMYDDFKKLAVEHGSVIPPLAGGRILANSGGLKMVMDEEQRTVTTQIVMSFDEARDPTKYLGSYYTKINNTLMMEKKTFK